MGGRALNLTALLQRTFHGLDRAGEWCSLLGLRLLLAYEFWESGWEKWHGENWFADLQGRFPFPFDQLPPELNWQLSTWTELIAPLLLVLGLGTRFAGLALMILTGVAWASVHAGNGYNVCDNGFKLPLFYLVMLLPLLLSGPGRLPIDAWIARRLGC